MHMRSCREECREECAAAVELLQRRNLEVCKRTSFGCELIQRHVRSRDFAAVVMRTVPKHECNGLHQAGLKRL